MQKGFAATLTGSRRERAVCAEVAQLAPGAVNFAGETSLSELAALIRRSTICVTNNSGPMHLAVALGRPVASVFGPTDAIWIGPYRRKNAVLQANLPALPATCVSFPLPARTRLHARVSARAVIERMEAMFGGRAASAGVVEMRAPVR